MKDASEAKTIAEGLWHRFRLLALVIDKTDRFIGMPPQGAPLPDAEDGARTPVWLESLAGDREQIEAIASDLVLRAVRAASEPLNFTILGQLGGQPSVSFLDLMLATQLNRLSLNERVNDLIQAGLAAKDAGSGQVQATMAGLALWNFVKDIQDGLFEIILEKLRDRKL